MAYPQLRDKEAILARLRADTALNIYQIGDLDPFFWPHTRWFAGEGNALALLYTGMETPCLLAFESDDAAASHEGDLRALLGQVAPQLAGPLNAHVSPRQVEVLAEHFHLESVGHYKKMVLRPSDARLDVATAGCETLTVADLGAIVDFYRDAYPDNWFDPRMLETGFYVGHRNGGTIACIAGVHVYSAEYAVAALGNIATAHEHRRQGLAHKCIAALCSRLFETVDCIGLNVKASNAAAITCYQRLGFRVAADFCELALREHAR